MLTAIEMVIGAIAVGGLALEMLIVAGLCVLLGLVNLFDWLSTVRVWLQRKLASYRETCMVLRHWLGDLAGHEGPVDPTQLDARLRRVR